MTTATFTGVIWLNSSQAAERAGCHVQTLLSALAAGELHGSQRKAGGRWRVHVDCLDAWAGGEPCKHQDHLNKTGPRHAC